MGSNTTEFQEEKKHLHTIQKDITTEMEKYIRKAGACFADIKANLDYEAVADWQQETARKQRMQGIVNTLREQYKNPYYGRLDLINSDTGELEQYYIGNSTLILNDTDQRVINWQSDFGDFYTDEKTEGMIAKTRYQLDLRRGIHIDEGKLKKVETTFQSGSSILGQDIVDPFLLAILKDKRRKSQPTEIIATINRKQNKIMRLPAEQDFVIQGCAGSGKTTVLFHRLSVLLYRQENTGMKRFCIVTPNDNFNTFIASLSKSLNLRGLRIRSAASYYMDLISSYGVPVNRKADLLCESVLNHEVLSRIYSRNYQKEIQQAFQGAWSKGLEELTRLGFFDILAERGINPGSVGEPSSIAHRYLDHARLELKKLFDEILGREGNASRLLEAALNNQRSLSKSREEKKLQNAAVKIHIYIQKEELELENQREALHRKLDISKRNMRPVTLEYADTTNRLTEKKKELEELQELLHEKDMKKIREYKKYSHLYADIEELELELSQLGVQNYVKARSLEKSIHSGQMDFMKTVLLLIRKDIAQDEQYLEELSVQEEKTGKILNRMSKEVEQIQLQYDRITESKSRLLKLKEVFKAQEDSAFPGGLKAYEDIPAVREYNTKKENLLWIWDKLKSLPQEIAVLQKELNRIRNEKNQLGFDAEFLDGASSTIELMSFQKLFDLFVRKPVYDELQLSEKVSGQYQFELYLMLFCCTLYFPLVRQEENLVCIDEAQDLSECELLTLKRVLGHRCHFNLYGDTNQLVYPYKGIRDWKQCRLTASMSVYELNQNYRNTRQITEFCNEEIDMKVQSIGIEGKVVKVIPESQLRLALMDCMPSENRSTAVIYSGTNSEVPAWLNRVLGHKHVAVGELHPKKVSVMTVEEAKGLEFYSVLVLPQGMSDNEQYVAFTRALHELTVIES